MNSHLPRFPLRFSTLIPILTIFTASLSTLGQSTSAAEARREPIKNVFWQPDQLQQGSPMLITCEFNAAAVKVSALWQGQHLQFRRTEKPRIWYAFAAVPMDAHPGPYDLKVTARMYTGHWASSVKTVNIAAANFGAGSADVPQQYVEPDATQNREIDRDALFKKLALSRDIRLPLWSGNFIKPIDAQSTPSFGETRLLNEEKTSQHMGTDYPAKEGTPVHASNSGVVVLARSLYYEGNCVIINHGQRLFTIYMHLSRIDVREGRGVRKDERIGLSGATGRVTGPHLHFEVQIAGMPVDPIQFLALTLPDLPVAERRRARLIK
jgi:murein DD-endopeptidase MepM/ murein hydrolase activator NlpD